ncbi:MAG: hypothetical protein GEU98_11165 [Pseudonocardiaceae bacterium]|nr:hypothetical protein [Pseudonocardiaceae bacterium]
MKQTLLTEDGRYVLRIERYFAHPQRKVWRSITEPEHFAQWYPFSTGEMDLRVGGKLGFDDGEGSTYEAVVTELDPPRVFAFREVDDTLRIELRPEGEGCLMIFTHTFDDPSWATHTAAGWHRCLDAVDMLLAGTPVEWPDNAAELREVYAKEFGLA